MFNAQFEQRIGVPMPRLTIAYRRSMKCNWNARANTLGVRITMMVHSSASKPVFVPARTVVELAIAPFTWRSP